MRLNVIIPSYNAAATISDTLDSIPPQGDEAPYEYDITVVDSTPDDSVENIVKSKNFDINFIKLTERAFPGKARNRGVEATSGDLLCFIDADAFAGSGWLDAIYAFALLNPDVPAFGGPVLNANPSDGYSRLAHWCEFSGYGNGAPEGPRRVQPTVNFAILRITFEQFGPFLEDQFGNEDVLLSQGLLKARMSIHFSRNIRVLHRNKTSLVDIYDHQFKLGESTGAARVRYNLPGSFLTRGSASLLIPLVKTHFVCYRLLTQEPDEFPRFMMSWPRVFGAMSRFASGFRKGVNEARVKADNR